MEKREYTVRFVTPAFLGGADKSAQWRTPPFKALLRQWWRVAHAPKENYDWKRIREEEGRLFGHAWLKNDKDNQGRKANSRKSKILVRFAHWNPGQQNSNWPGGQMEKVVTTKDGKGRVRADLYLGFGAVLPPKGGSSIILRAGAIAAGEENTLTVGFPENSDMKDVLLLIGWFGSLGSRSHNGWGSLQLDGMALPTAINLQPFARELSQCLTLDWAHAIGKDEEGVLVWLTEPKKDWRAAMSALAHIKVGVRATAKKFRDISKICGVHLLGYPAGGDWTLREFPKEARLSSQLRFKVFDTNKWVVGVIYHVPAKLPEVLRSKLTDKQKQWLQVNELSVWRAIHEYLESNSRISRFK